MYETGIYDLSQFYDTNVLVQSFKDKTISSHTNTEQTVLNHLKLQKHCFIQSEMLLADHQGLLDHDCPKS